jgi:hypothetical protein
MSAELQAVVLFERSLVDLTSKKQSLSVDLPNPFDLEAKRLHRSSRRPGISSTKVLQSPSLAGFTWPPTSCRNRPA